MAPFLCGCGLSFDVEARLKDGVGQAALERLDAEPVAQRDQHVLGGAGDLPFRGNSFDIVTANMVVEHVPDPSSILKEIHRVLRPGGLFIFHTANSGNLMVKIASGTPNAVKRKIVFLMDGRRGEDIFETCYRFNAPDVIRAQAASAGYETISVQQINSSPFMTGMLMSVKTRSMSLRFSRIRIASSAS
jgi:ubiquinone/menaquinone biosynthesis C-methylase UbiE